MTIGLYVHGDTPLHRLPPGVKVAFLAIAGIVVFLIEDPGWLAGLTSAAAALLAVTGVPGREAWRQLRPFVVLAAVVVLVHGLLTTWTAGLIIVLRFAALLLLALAVTVTTRVTDMIDALEVVLSPLARLGVNPAKVSLALSLALRFIPLLAQVLHEVREARWARGGERDLVGLVVPVVVRTLRLADDLTEAIEARGFDP